MIYALFGKNFFTLMRASISERLYGHPDFIYYNDMQYQLARSKKKLFPRLKPKDCPEFMAHVFMLTLKQAIVMLKTEMIFGRPCARFYSIEF